MGVYYKDKLGTIRKVSPYQVREVREKEVDWFYPLDWVICPPMPETQKIYLIYKIYANQTMIALSGEATAYESSVIDWGDGTPVAQLKGMNSYTKHVYDYNTLITTTLSDGAKTVLVTVSHLNQSITDLSLTHPFTQYNNLVFVRGNINGFKKISLFYSVYGGSSSVEGVELFCTNVLKCETILRVNSKLKHFEFKPYLKTDSWGLLFGSVLCAGCKGTFYVDFSEASATTSNWIGSFEGSRFSKIKIRCTNAKALPIYFSFSNLPELKELDLSEVERDITTNIRDPAGNVNTSGLSIDYCHNLEKVSINLSTFKSPMLSLAVSPIRELSLIGVMQPELKNIDLRCTYLNIVEVLNVIDKLYDRTLENEAGVIDLALVEAGKLLTPEQVALATAKNWTISI